MALVAIQILFGHRWFLRRLGLWIFGIPGHAGSRTGDQTGGDIRVLANLLAFPAGGGEILGGASRFTTDGCPAKCQQQDNRRSNHDPDLS